MWLNFDPTGERGMFNHEIFRMSLITGGHILSRQISFFPFHPSICFVASHGSFGVQDIFCISRPTGLV